MNAFILQALRSCVAIPFIVMLALPASAAEVGLYAHKWGVNCNSSDSFAVKMRNNTHQTRAFKVCLERQNGTWSCYWESSLRPGEVYPTSWGFSVCNGTGRYKTWNKVAGSNKRFGEP